MGKLSGQPVTPLYLKSSMPIRLMQKSCEKENQLLFGKPFQLVHPLLFADGLLIFWWLVFLIMTRVSKIIKWRHQLGHLPHRVRADCWALSNLHPQHWHGIHITLGTGGRDIRTLRGASRQRWRPLSVRHHGDHHTLWGDFGEQYIFLLTQTRPLYHT